MFDLGSAVCRLFYRQNTSMSFINRFQKVKTQDDFEGANTMIKMIMELNPSGSSLFISLLPVLWRGMKGTSQFKENNAENSWAQECVIVLVWFGFCFLRAWTRNIWWQSTSPLPVASGRRDRTQPWPSQNNNVVHLPTLPDQAQAGSEDGFVTLEMVALMAHL